MRNWQALDQPERAASARRWFHASLAMLMLMLQSFTSALNTRLGTEPLLLLHPASLLFLLVWYFAALRPQTRLVKAHFGAGYRRKRWDGVRHTGGRANGIPGRFWFMLGLQPIRPRSQA